MPNSSGVPLFDRNTRHNCKHASSNEGEEAGSLMRRSTLAVSAGRSPKKMKSFALSFAQRNTESRAYFQAEERLSDQRNGAPNRS